jgi:hypothetical protein
MGLFIWYFVVKIKEVLDINKEEKIKSFFFSRVY